MHLYVSDNMVEGSDILTYDKKDGWSTNGSEPLCHESASG